MDREPTPSHPNAKLLPRLLAVVYDSLVVVALVMVATALLLPLTGGEAIDPGEGWYRLYLLWVIYLFFIGFWLRAGHTLGMRAWRLQLTDAAGGRPDLAHVSLRWVCAWLAWAPLGLGVIWMLVDRQGLCLHDRLSSTRVVRLPKP